MQDDFNGLEGNVVSGEIGDSNQNNSNPIVSPAIASEKMLPQSKVNSLIGHAKAEAYQKAQQEFMRQQSIQQSSQQSNQPSNQGNASFDDQQRLIAENVDRRLKEIQDHAQQQYMQQQANQILTEFASKVSDAHLKYPDFNEKVLALGLDTVNPNLPYLSNTVSNTADVLYELANNPMKAQYFNDTASKGAAGKLLAERQIRELSESIANNQHALNQPTASPPLSSIRASSIPMDNGPRTASDFSKLSYLKA